MKRQVMERVKTRARTSHTFPKFAESATNVQVWISRSFSLVLGGSLARSRSIYFFFFFAFSANPIRFDPFWPILHMFRAELVLSCSSVSHSQHLCFVLLLQASIAPTTVCEIGFHEPTIGDPQQLRNLTSDVHVRAARHSRPALSYKIAANVSRTCLLCGQPSCSPTAFYHGSVLL